MPPIYVTHQNSKLHVRNRRLQVEIGDGNSSEVLASLPLAHVSQVVLFGNVGLTTPAIDALLVQGVEVVFLTLKGEYRGRLAGSVTPHVPLRRAQYRRLEDTAFVLEMAKGFVRAKLTHQRTLLLRHNRDREEADKGREPHGQHPADKEHPAEIAAAARQIAQAIEDVPRKVAINSLLGVEGSATAAYFRGFKRLFAPEWKFQDRNRRPPQDPVNVLLSFGYTLLTNLASSAIQATGLDPYAGFLHEVAYNRPALGLDLVEEFRPVVDGVVLWCCNSGQITPDDFTPGPPERPVVLGEQGQRRFLQAADTVHPIRAAHGDEVHPPAAGQTISNAAVHLRAGAPNR